MGSRHSAGRKTMSKVLQRQESQCTCSGSIDSPLTCHAPEGERVVHVHIWSAPSAGAVVECLQIVAGSSNVIAAQHLRPIEGEEDLGRNHCKISRPQRSRRGTGWHEECAGQGLTQKRAGVVDMMQATTHHDNYCCRNVSAHHCHPIAVVWCTVGCLKHHLQHQSQILFIAWQLQHEAQWSRVM